jgi:hypothetical protein
MLETPALWAATAVTSRAWMRSESLDKRMVGITKVQTKGFDREESRDKTEKEGKMKKESKRQGK